MAKKKSKKTAKKKFHIGIIYRPRKPKAFSLAKELANWLTHKGASAYSYKAQKLIPGTQAIGDNSLKKLDYLVALGGDGTYLRANRILGDLEVPIIGVHMGSLGFLTEVTTQNMYSVMEDVLHGEAKFSPRSMIEVLVKSAGKTKKYLALNDMVIERGTVSRLINMSIYSNDKLITDIKADGLIISSPTGSTAYNLAAGGPIAHPDVKGIMITPISAHSLTLRPIIVPDNHKLTIDINPSPEKMEFLVDGERFERVSHKDKITIKKSKIIHKKIDLKSQDYFDVLRKKLNFGQRD